MDEENAWATMMMMMMMKMTKMMKPSDYSYHCRRRICLLVIISTIVGAIDGTLFLKKRDGRDITTLISMQSLLSNNSITGEDIPAPALASSLSLTNESKDSSTHLETPGIAPSLPLPPPLQDTETVPEMVTVQQERSSAGQ